MTISDRGRSLTGGARRRGRARRPRPSSREGFALPVALGFLVALALLSGTAALIVGSSHRVGGLQAGAGRAFEAAGSGLDHGFVVLADSTSSTADWPVTGAVGAYGYRVELARDTFDFGAGPRPVSFDEERAPSFNGDGRGDTVYVLRSQASFGRIRSRQEQWLTRRSIPRLPAALTVHARGATEWVGGWSLSGTNVTHSGVPVDAVATDTTGVCGENRPALAVTERTTPVPFLQLSASGNPSHSGHNPPYVVRGTKRTWSSPEDVLRVPSGALDAFRRSGYLHGLAPPDTLSGVIWITDEAGGPMSCLSDGGCGDIQGTGVLIVHNPRYDPRQHDPTDPRYDPLIALDPAFGPATLRDLSGGTFRGILIVDELPRTTSGPASIRGAVVELSRRPAAERFDWDPGTHVEYSCPAIADAARLVRSGPRVLAWKG